MAMCFRSCFLLLFLVTITTLVLSQESPELNKVCYGRSDYHVASQSTVVYDGDLNTTVSGNTCLHWKVDPFTSDKPDHSEVLDEPHNYCRGVDTRRGRPWCYIDFESSKFSVHHGVRRGWDWCNVKPCHYYRTECQSLRDRFDSAEKEYNKSVAAGREPFPNIYCRPACNDNGDFEMEQHCNREFTKTEESTGVCITWDNNAEDPDFVYNKVNKTCEVYTKCRYDRWLGKNVECYYDSGELKPPPIIIPSVRHGDELLDMTAFLEPQPPVTCGDGSSSSAESSGSGSGDGNGDVPCVPVLGEALDDSNDYSGGTDLSILDGFSDVVTDIIDVTNFHTDISKTVSEFDSLDDEINDLIENDSFLMVTEGQLIFD